MGIQGILSELKTLADVGEITHIHRTFFVHEFRLNSLQIVKGFYLVFCFTS